MMCELFILVFAGTACMCSSATPAAPKNFNDALSCLLPFSWMMAKCPRKLFLPAGVATWRMAPLLCQVYCNRRTQARFCASSWALLIAGPWWMSAIMTHEPPIHTSITGGAFDKPWLTFFTRCLFFLSFSKFHPYQDIAWLEFSGSCRYVGFHKQFYLKEKYYIFSCFYFCTEY